MAEVFYEKGKKYNCIVHGTPYYRKTATINGKRHSFYGDGEKDVNNKIEEAKKLSASGLNYDSRTSKVGDVLKYWLYNVKRVGVKASTFSRYEGSYRVHMAGTDVARIVLSKLESATMQAHITSLYEDEHKPYATIKNVVKLWRMFFAWAQKEGYIVKDPCKNLSIPGKAVNPHHKVETFSEEERAAIEAYMSSHEYIYDTVIRLAFATGMREGELLSLKWADVQDDCIHIERSTAIVTHIDKDGNRERYREVWNTKTENSVRVIPLLPETVQMLKEHREKQTSYLKAMRLPASPYVFTNTSGKLIDPSNLRVSYVRMLQSAGVPYRRFHCIRHTFATTAIRSGVDPKDLQMLLGHSDIETTYIYVESDNDSKRKAIEKMGALL